MTSSTETSSADRALALVGQLHRGILSNAEWAGALDALAAYVGADHAGSVVWNRYKKHVLVNDGGMLENDAVQAYQDTFQYQDPARASLIDAAVGSIYVDQMDLGAQQIRDSPFYRDFLRPNGLESVMAMLVDRTEDVVWVVAFQRVIGRPLFDVENAVALRQLLPHLQTAFRLKHKLRQLHHAHAWSLLTLNRVAFPLVVVDHYLEVISANQAGKHWMRAHPRPLEDPSSRAAIQAAVNVACGASSKPGRVATASINTEAGRDSLMLVLPVTAPEDDAREFRHPCAMLAGIGMQPRPVPSETLLRELFSLTRAEIVLAGRLANGLTLAESAEAGNLSRETVRTHLKSVMRKTGTRRQAELTVLLSGLTTLIDNNDTA